MDHEDFQVDFKNPINLTSRLHELILENSLLRKSLEKKSSTLQDYVDMHFQTSKKLEKIYDTIIDCTHCYNKIK